MNIQKVDNDNKDYSFTNVNEAVGFILFMERLGFIAVGVREQDEKTKIIMFLG